MYICIYAILFDMAFLSAMPAIAVISPSLPLPLTCCLLPRAAGTAI